LSELVLDASVALAWCFSDEREVYADAVMFYLKNHTAVVPALWFFEVANGIAVAERRGRIPPAEIARVINLIAPLAIRFDSDLTISHTVANVVRLAQRTKLSAYDAGYLELAMRLGLPLATVDPALRRAAVDNNVEAFSPPS
jgi:predicted nucleic acid-binding protein